MPIRKENKKLYPKNWKQISEDIRFNRADNLCEVCGAVNYSHVNKFTREICLPDEDDVIKIVLTVAHLDHDPTNNDYSNLKAMCQKCHNSYDAPFRAKNRKMNKLKDSGFKQLTIW
jgi:5-methylcytosine-specific restriction endonuclease McrA